MTQRSAPGHVALLTHAPPVPKTFEKQKHPPSVVKAHRHVSLPQVPAAPAHLGDSVPAGHPNAVPHEKQREHSVQRPYWAKAGVRRLVSTGADQAIAAPAPMRFSIRRREILSGPRPSSGLTSIG